MNNPEVTPDFVNWMGDQLDEMDRLRSLSNQELVTEGLMLDFPDLIIEELCTRVDPQWCYRGERGH